MNKQFYDDGAFYVEHKSWGTWQSHYPDGKGLITSLTEEECIRASRFILQFRQDEKNGKIVETKTYSGEVGGKL